VTLPLAGEGKQPEVASSHLPVQLVLVLVMPVAGTGRLRLGPGGSESKRAVQVTVIRDSKPQQPLTLAQHGHFNIALPGRRVTPSPSQPEAASPTRKGRIILGLG
jgi:hypothetical protein